MVLGLTRAFLRLHHLLVWAGSKSLAVHRCLKGSCQGRMRGYAVAQRRQYLNHAWTCRAMHLLPEYWLNLQDLPCCHVQLLLD